MNCLKFVTFITLIFCIKLKITVSSSVFWLGEFNCCVFEAQTQVVALQLSFTSLQFGMLPHPGQSGG